VIARLRPKLGRVAGARLFLQAVQDIRVGGRQSNSQFQFTLQSDTLSELYAWGPKLVEALRRDTSVITDVDSDQQQRGLQVNLTIDRDAAARLGVSSRTISATLYDAFGQRQVSTIYNALNQYHVVMEVHPDFWENPESLNDIYVSTSGAAISGAQATAAVGSTASASTTPMTAPLTGAGATLLDPGAAVRNQRTNAIAVSGRGTASTGAAVSTTPETMIPLLAVTNYEFGTAPLGVYHQGLFVASTVSFNLTVGKTLSDAVAYVNSTMREIGMPPSTAPSRAPRAPSSNRSTASFWWCWRRWRRSTSCSASCTRATSTRSRSCRPCRRPVSARCWRCSSPAWSSASSP
jgi:multidrug efflux pump